MKAKTEEEFRSAVKLISEKRDDWTSVEQGWPWPWNDSFTTDRTYAFVDGKTQDYNWGCLPLEDEDEDTVKTVEWPNMESRKNVNYGNRSGLLFLSL